MRQKTFDDKVRQFDCTLFKALPIGARFRFGSEVSYPCLGMKTGVCVKLSARKYRYEEDGQMCQVGSTSVVVLKVGDDGEPIRVGHCSPYLGD